MPLRDRVTPALLLVAVTIISVALQVPTMQELVIWDLSLIKKGEWWRLISGNFTHTNGYHLLMNMAALWVIGFIFRPSSKALAAPLLALSLTTGVLLLFSDISRYAGLSGVLHGLFAFYAMREVFQGRISSWLLLGGVTAKVAYEQWFGASESTARLIGASVAVDAHLAGCAAGITLAAILHLYLCQRRKQKTPL